MAKMCAFYGLLTVKYAIYWTQLSAQSSDPTSNLEIGHSVCSVMLRKKICECEQVPGLSQDRLLHIYYVDLGV